MVCAAALLLNAQHAMSEPVLDLSASQSFRFDDNPTLSPVSPGEVFISSTGLEAGVTSRTSLALLGLRAGADITQAVGEGETNDLDGVNPFVEGGFQVNGTAFDISGLASFRIRPVSIARDESLTGFDLPGGPLPDLTAPPPSVDVTSAAARRLDFGTRLQIALDLDQLTRASTFLSAGFVRFDSRNGPAANELVDSNAFGVGFGLERRLTPRLGVEFSASTSLFDPDGGATGSSFTHSAEFGAKWRLTPRHTFSLRGGGAIVDRRRGLAGTGDTTFAFVGAAEMQYALSDATLTFGVSQSVEPSSLGELQRQTGIDASLEYAVNDRLRLGLDAAFSLERSVAEAGATDRTLLAFAPRASYQLTNSVEANLGFRFQRSDQEGRSDAFSNAVFLTISKSFSGAP